MSLNCPICVRDKTAGRFEQSGAGGLTPGLKDIAPGRRVYINGRKFRVPSDPSRGRENRVYRNEEGVG